MYLATFTGKGIIMFSDVITTMEHCLPLFSTSCPKHMNVYEKISPVKTHTDEKSSVRGTKGEMKRAKKLSWTSGQASINLVIVWIAKELFSASHQSRFPARLFDFSCRHVIMNRFTWKHRYACLSYFYNLYISFSVNYQDNSTTDDCGLDNSRKVPFPTLVMIEAGIVQFMHVLLFISPQYFMKTARKCTNEFVVFYEIIT